MANLSKKTCLLISFFIFVLFVFIPPTSFAITQEECEKKIGKEKLSLDELKECERIFNDLQQKSKAKQETLSAAIAYFENKIRLTTTLIAQNEEKLKILEKEIEQLTLKIGRLDESLETISQLLVFRIIETYKKATVNPVYLFLSSDGFSQFLTRYNYLKIVQAHDRQLLFKMEQARFDYDAQKALKEEKQKEVEAVKSLLEKQKLALDQQKKDKVYLLEVTKNDEKRYQDLLVAALAEHEAIEAAMRQALELLEEGTPVEKGTIVALMGNSGYPCCSTGLHLHFMITTGCKVEENKIWGCTAVNPANYLKSIPVTWDNSPDGEFAFSGDWDWPISEPRITQGYGMTSFARTGFYGGNPHTGIDMVNESHIIKAPKGGTLYKGSTSCGKDCPISFVFIDHGDGLISWYWHVQ